MATAYSAAKPAAWGLTEAARVELAPQGIVVTGVHVGAIDTDMMAAYDVPKNAPADVAAKVLAGIDAGAYEVLVDAESVEMKAGLAQTPEVRYRHILV
jgi:NAD(P)-dependent dehydrogenase (short-subunit alcohol dehydrogenase family)